MTPTNIPHAITLRAPEPSDVDFIYLLENASSSDNGHIAPLSRKLIWDYVNDYNGDLYACGQLRLIACDDRGNRVGIIDLYDYDRINRRAYTGIIVTPDKRGCGIGREMLRQLIDMCRERWSMKNLAAIVRHDNTSSVRLFEKTGFKITGEFPHWLRHGTEFATALHLQLNLFTER